MGGFPENPPSDVLLKYRRLLGLVNNKDEARNWPWVLSHRSDLNQAGGAYLAPKMLFLKRNPKFIFGLERERVVFIIINCPTIFLIFVDHIKITQKCKGNQTTMVKKYCQETQDVYYLIFGLRLDQ